MHSNSPGSDPHGDEDRGVSGMLGLSYGNMAAALQKEIAAIDAGTPRASLANVHQGGKDPSCLATPFVQVVIMGVIFLFVFVSFSTIQVFSSTLYGQTLGANINMTLYLVFAFGCFVAPSITQALGAKVTMFLGIIGYAMLVVTGLIYFEAGGGHGPDCCTALQYVPIAGGALLGFGAAILWTAQGQLFLDYTTAEDRGSLFGVFWAFFQGAALLGGVLALVYFNQNPGGANTVLYIIFLVMIVIGAGGVFVLQDPEAMVIGGRAQDNTVAPQATAWQDFTGTLSMFATKRMACLGILFFYTGFNQPYQLNTFGGRFFNKTSLAIGQIVFYSLEVVGALVYGNVLDAAKPSERRKRGMISLLVLSIFTLGGFFFAWQKENEHTAHPNPFHNSTYPLGVHQIEPFEEGFWGPLAAFALWGLSDAMVQTYAYWLLGSLYQDGAEKGKAVGFYKMTQSFGWAAGFALMPTSRLSPMNQLYATAASFVVGTLLSLLELPPVEVDADAHAGADDYHEYGELEYDVKAPGEAHGI